MGQGRVLGEAKVGKAPWEVTEQNPPGSGGNELCRVGGDLGSWDLPASGQAVRHKTGRSWKGLEAPTGRVLLDLPKFLDWPKFLELPIFGGCGAWIGEEGGSIG